MVFYAPDLDYYEQKDQFYIDYREMPGPIITDEARLAAAVKEVLIHPPMERLHRFRQKYMGACDGHALERLIKQIGL